MIRDFSGKKKEELYRALDGIDDREWKSFMVWCGGRADDFREWVERLDISFYIRQIDNYQNEVLRTNDSTREQIDIIFENVAETDRRYAETFSEYAEAVKEQMARVSVMTEVMRAAGEPEADIKAMLCNVENQRNTRLEYAERCLDSCLEERGYTNSIEREFIVNMIRKERPDLLEELYSIKSYNVSFWEIPMKKIEDYYSKHKMDITMEDVEELKLGGMSLQKIQKRTFVECWNYLFSMGLTVDQVIATIANIYSEGELSPTNRQNTKENMNIEDLDYIYLTDDNVGYGICQWTYYSRKEGLQNMANEMGKEVSDLDVQLAYFQYEMEESFDFRDIWRDFLAEQDREAATIFFYENIEKPKSSSDKNSAAYNIETAKRIGYADDIAEWYETIFNF